MPGYIAVPLSSMQTLAFCYQPTKQVPTKMNQCLYTTAVQIAEPDNSSMTPFTNNPTNRRPEATVLLVRPEETNYSNPSEILNTMAGPRHWSSMKGQGTREEVKEPPQAQARQQGTKGESVAEAPEPQPGSTLIAQGSKLSGRPRS
ncbi:hypothetical protein CEK25_004618 [Fusarium fujikuroi]|nr:hypothetical protein CEK25_004618 [Fusarium fujikuroi]